MESYTTLLEAFEALNERKRQDPGGLTNEEKSRWKEMRREIEKILFNTEPDPATDTREFLRVPVSLSVRYWTRNELKDRYIPVLGEGGLFVNTVDPLPVGSIMDLEIELARKGLSFKVKGEVVWVNTGDDPAKHGMGIKFANLTYEQRCAIYSLVDDTLRQRMLERRQYARVDARLEVNFVYAEGYFELRTEDLSLGGLFIATDHLVPVGEQVRLMLKIREDQPPIQAVGEVVRVVEEAAPGLPAGLGVQFVEMDAEGMRAIRNFLSARVSGEQAPSELERRRHPRVERLIKLSFQTGDAVGTTLARDISTGGVFIQTHEPPAIGTRIMVSLVHPLSQTKLELRGKVVRVVEVDLKKPHRVPGVGVAFDEELSEDKLKLLREFMRDYALLQSGDALKEEAEEEEQTQPE